MSLGVITSNKCTITAAEGLITAVGDPTGLNTGSQKNNGVSVDKSDLTHIVFDAEVDNKNQSSVAAAWNCALDKSPARMYSYQLLGTNTSLPDELNFFFNFEMTIDGEQYTIYLGQGSYKTSAVSHTNNWWIGSSNMTSLYQVKFGGVSLASICLLHHGTSGLLSLPSVNSVTFQGASSLTITHLTKPD